jgi:HEAT repeat protein
MAVNHLLPLLSSRDSDIRFYATFMFSALKFPEALDDLTDRLFDQDRHIRAMAVDVIRSFTAHTEYRWAMQKIVSVMESSDRDLEAKYLAAEALGNLGEPLALEPLVALLGSADEKLVKITHRALVKIALLDHGFTEKRWLDWYAKNKERSRIEWAIDGLANEEEEIRELAYRALKSHIGDVLVETPLPTNLREYKELKERLYLWWEEEGKEIHQLTEGI